MMAEILKNPAVKRALEMGEERMGRLVTQLLSNEKVMHGVQTMVSSALQAKSTFDRGVKTAMQVVNLPSSDDLEELRRKIAELESEVEGLNAKLAASPGKKGENGA